MSNKIIVGRFGATYGVRGWLKVISFTQPIENILTYQPWFIEKNKSWELVTVSEGKPHGKNVVVKLANCNDPETARFYTNRDIAVDHSELPKLPAHEYYWSDLIGLRVTNQNNEDLGIVESLFATGANDVLVVKGDRERFIPYLSYVIISVDLAQKKMVVDWDSDF